jgi:hypothetical protein
MCTSVTRLLSFDCGWFVVLLMRYLGIGWGLGYPREQVGAVLPSLVFIESLRSRNKKNWIWVKT